MHKQICLHTQLIIYLILRDQVFPKTILYKDQVDLLRHCNREMCLQLGLAFKFGDMLSSLFLLRFLQARLEVLEG